MPETDMSISNLLSKRRVVPRWRPPNQSVEIQSHIGKLRDNSSNKIDNWVKKLSAIYKQTPSIQTAREIHELKGLYNINDLDLTSVISKDHLRAIIFAEQKILNSNSKTNGHNAPPIELTNNDFGYLHACTKISQQRKILRDQSNRPFAWSELARLYTIVGQGDKAIKAITTALHLAQGNRYLYRIASRLYIHLDNPEMATHLLRKHPGISQDPWLISAEIAATSIQGRSSKFIKKGISHLSNSRFSSIEISELAASIATLELENGSLKKSKKLFNQSLINPTENVLAQVQWASDKNSKIILPKKYWDIPNSFEARALFFRSKRKYHQAQENCKLWLLDEPYSARPAMIGAYIGVLLGDYRSAITYIKAGLRSEPNNWILLNNRAVIYAYQGNLSLSIQDIRQALAKLQSRDDPHILATLGLIAFRNGELSLGRELYAKSISWFKKTKRKAAVASAILHWTREEIIRKSISITEVEKITKRIRRSEGVYQIPELLELADIIDMESHSRGYQSPMAFTLNSQPQIATQKILDCANTLNNPVSNVSNAHMLISVDAM